MSVSRYYGRTQKELIELTRDTFVKNRTFDRSYSSIKQLAQDSHEIHGTQSLNRNFLTRTTPTSPTSVHTNDLMNASSKSTSNLNTTSMSVGNSNRKTNHTSFHDMDSWTHGSHTLDSRLAQRYKNDTESDVDNEDEGYLNKIKSKSLANKTRLRENRRTPENTRQKINSNMNKIHARREVKDLKEERHLHTDYAQADYDEPNRLLSEPNSYQNSKMTDVIDDGKTSFNTSHSIFSSHSSISDADRLGHSIPAISLTLRLSSPSLLSSPRPSSVSSSSSSCFSFHASNAARRAQVDDVDVKKTQSLPKLRECIDLVQLNQLPSANARSYRDDTTDGPTYDDVHCKTLIDSLDLSVSEPKHDCIPTVCR
jgi:hypothetical protein